HWMTELIEDSAELIRADPDFSCVAVGYWWLDMDDIVNTGFVDVPIAVTLRGRRLRRRTRCRQSGRYVVARVPGEEVTATKLWSHGGWPPGESKIWLRRWVISTTASADR